MTERDKHASDYIEHTRRFAQAREAAAPGTLPTGLLYAEGLNAKYILETNDPTPDAWIPWAEANDYLGPDGKITQAGLDKIMEPIT